MFHLLQNTRLALPVVLVLPARYTAAVSFYSGPATNRGKISDWQRTQFILHQLVN
jgi:hypothetical protein